MKKRVMNLKIKRGTLEWKKTEIKGNTKRKSCFKKVIERLREKKKIVKKLLLF